MDRIELTETGCHIDSHRGHYAIRDAIELAQGYGFIIGPFEQFAIDRYEPNNADENYPHDGLVELCDDAESWLNCGENSGLDRAIKGQNNPPKIPAGTVWGWNDGDFGLYDESVFED